VDATPATAIRHYAKHVQTGSGDPSYTRLRHLQTISEAALAHLEFDDLIVELLARVSGILSTDTVAVLLLDEEADELVARAARGLEEEVEARVRVPLGRGFAGRIAKERRPIIIHDVAHADIFNPILVEKGLQSLLGVPLLVEGRVIGVLHVGTLTPRTFTDDDAELLQLAADRIALAIDHARLYESEREAAGQLRRLERVTEAALAHLDLDELLEVLLTRIRDLISTDTVVVQLLDAEEERLFTRATLGVGAGQKARSVAVGEGFTGRVAAEARPLTTDDGEEGPVASMLGVPLVVGGEVRGVLGVGTTEPRIFTEQDVDLLERVGDRIALAIENARLYAAQREAAEQLRRLESITEVALHHITLEDEVLERMVSRVREALEVDTAALLVTNESTQTLVSRAGDGAGEQVERGVEVPIGRGFAGRVAEMREPLVIEDASDFEVVSPLLRERGVRSLMGVPLAVEDRLLGVLFVGSVEPRHFSDRDQSLLELAGDRLAVALDHSRLYEREHMVAETLQRTLLPDRLPELQGADSAARYLPGEGEAVGGDWYDIVPMRDGRVALAMGDVVSHGVRAASVMGQLRNALRAYALEHYEPEMVLARLNGVTRSMEGREMATLLFAVYDPESGSLKYASAGHPPPLILEPDGVITLLEEGRGPPLGAVPDSLFSEGRAQLEPGATLLLYTDGIVERRDMWIDEGLERLTAAAAEIGDVEPDELLDRLVETLLPGGRAADDVALLAVRAEPSASGPLRLKLPADPTVLVTMRQSLRQWLVEAGAGEDDAYDVLVATTEAAANAVEHAYGPGDASFRIEARDGGHGEISVIVRDQGAWRPPRGQNRGRGTLLMQELMDDFEVTTGESGTEVRMLKRLTSAVVA
jgi:GAF domain-containing protein/anti-sigma regulatory factor (Ser/Thr protein kinase)